MPSWPALTQREAAELRQAVAYRIAEVRKSRRLTQAQMADRLEWTRSKVGMIEAGHQELTVHQLVDLARCLETTVINLFHYAWAMLPHYDAGKARHFKSCKNDLRK